MTSDVVSTIESSIDVSYSLFPMYVRIFSDSRGNAKIQSQNLRLRHVAEVRSGADKNGGHELLLGASSTLLEQPRL